MLVGNGAYGVGVAGLMGVGVVGLYVSESGASLRLCVSVERSLW